MLPLNFLFCYLLFIDLLKNQASFKNERKFMKIWIRLRIQLLFYFKKIKIIVKKIENRFNF